MNKIVEAKFIEKGHKYIYENKNYKSISHYLDEIYPFDMKVNGIPTCLPWLRKVANKYQYPKLFELVNDLKDGLDFLKQENDTAKHKGNIVHYWIQQWLNWEMEVTEVGGEAEVVIKKELLKIIKYDEYKVIDMEVPLLDIDLKVSGKYDALLRTDNGKYILIDFKTGSRVDNDKENRVMQQLGWYSHLAEQHLDIKIDKLLCISAYEDKNDNYKIKGETLDFSAIKNELQEIAIENIKHIQQQQLTHKKFLKAKRELRKVNK